MAEKQLKVTIHKHLIPELDKLAKRRFVKRGTLVNDILRECLGLDVKMYDPWYMFE